MNRHELLRRFPGAVALISLAILVGVNIYLQSNFTDGAVMRSNFTTFLPLILVAIGQTYVVLAGDVDLSVSPTAALVNVVTVTVMSKHGIAMGMASGLGTGLLCGLINGTLVALLRFQPVVATFATGIVYAGVALYVLPQAGLPAPDPYWQGYASNWMSVPVVAWIFLASLLCILVLSRQRFRNHLLGVGGNRAGAFQTGLRVALVRSASYCICGMFTAVAALCLTGEMASGDPLIGQSLTLSSVSAVVLGGTALRGGFGSPVGSILGALTLGMIGNVIFFARLPFAYQTLVQGLAVMAALAGGVVMTQKRRA